jgi:hypothetical protein
MVLICLIHSSLVSYVWMDTNRWRRARTLGRGTWHIAKLLLWKEIAFDRRQGTYWHD